MIVKHKGFSPIIILIILGVSVLFGYLFLKQNNSSNNSKIITNLPTNIPKETVNPSNYPQPIITGNTLTSPVIRRPDAPRKIKWTLVEGWKFEQYDFPWCEHEKGVCEYRLEITNKTKPGYSMYFNLVDAGGGQCDFNRNKGKSDAVLNYGTIDAKFGPLRFDSSDDQGRYFGCQDTANDNIWNNYTDIGFIMLNTPPSPDTILVQQMIQMLKMIEKETLQQ